MRIIEILAEEHRWIGDLLDALESLARAAGPGDKFDPHASAELVAILDFFADGLHQRKEEHLLFPRLLARTSLSEQVFVSKLFEEHQRERRCMKGLRAHLLGAIFGASAHRREFIRAATAYVEMQRAHVAQENSVLLPLALRSLTEADDRDLSLGSDMLEKEAEIDRKRLGERIRSLSESLTARARPVNA